MRIFLITPYGKDYPIAARVMDDLLADDTLEEDVSVYNPAALYASPDAPVGNHMLLRETLPRLLDAEAVLYLPGWMSDPMALMHASIAQAINLVQWIPSDPLPVIEEEPVVDEDEEDEDWNYGSLDFSHGERGKYADAVFEPLSLPDCEFCALLETEDAPLHRDSGDEHKEPRA